MEEKQGKRWLETLCALCLGACIALGGIGCIMTGFRLPGSWLSAWRFCVIAAGIMALCCHWKYGPWLLLPLSGGLVFYLMNHSGWLTQLESLLFSVSAHFDAGYGWGVISWSGRMLAGRPVRYALELISLLPCLAVVWTVRRRRRVWAAAGLSFAPLGACLVVTDTVPEALPLAMVLLGMGLLLLTQGSRRQNAWEGCKLTVMLLPPVALLLAAVSWAVPQEGFTQGELALHTRTKLVDWVTRLPFVSQNEDQLLILDLSGDGLEEKVDLAAIGPNRQLRYQVMEVTADTGGPLYLRGQALGRYTGTDWELQETSFSTEFLPQEQYIAYALTEYDRRDLGDVTVETIQTKDVLYTPYYPQNRQLSDWLEGDAYARNPEGLKTYTLRQSGRLPEGGQTMTVEEQNLLTRYLVFAEENYLELPEQTRNWAQEFLTTRVFAGNADSPWFSSLADAGYGVSANEIQSLAGSIRAWLVGYGRYDLNTARMPREEQDFARWFLENSDTGYCVHYATAAVVLLRAAGIPARYVSGYLADVSAGVPTTVTSDRAHAWAEYFLPGTGWVVLDATPSQSERGPQIPVAATDPTEVRETTRPERPAAEATAPAQKPDTRQEAEVPEASWLPLVGKVLGVLAKVLLCLGAIWMQSRLRLLLRRNWLRRGSAKQQVLRWWRYACGLARVGAVRLPEELHELALEARFSHHDFSGEQIEAFSRFCQSLCDGLKTKSLLKRMVCRIVWAIW